jgi:hypothetical protein
MLTTKLVQRGTNTDGGVSMMVDLHNDEYWRYMAYRDRQRVCQSEGDYAPKRLNFSDWDIIINKDGIVVMDRDGESGVPAQPWMLQKAVSI